MIASREYLYSFIPLIDFLAEILGKNSEIVLHDLRDLDASVLAIKNNHLTKRVAGDPATDYVLKVVKEGIDERIPFTVKYRDLNHNNRKIRSVSYYIRYEKELIGMICVNTDESVFDEIKEQMASLEMLLGIYKQNESKPSMSVEMVSRSLEEMAENAVLEVSMNQGISVNKFKQDEKFATIENLYEKGFFLLKGSVPEVARILQISEPTVYRYLQSIKVK